jgi:hypothetical protein
MSDSRRGGEGVDKYMVRSKHLKKLSITNKESTTRRKECPNYSKSTTTGQNIY